MELEGHLYRLIANICHEGGVDSHSYKIHVRRADKWFVIQDLTVDRVSPDEVIRSEAYIQLYEKA
jgi:ubiquitin C-terminal hydrolase